MVQLSGELVCSFKSVQCSTSSSKIGHLITMVAFQLHWLHFNCTSCISIALVAFQLHWLHFLGLTLSPGWRAREQDMRVALSAGVPILRYTAGVSILCCSISELWTTPLRKVEQIRSANLLQRLDEYVNERKGSKVEALEEEEVESSVLFSNYSQTIMLPQLSPSLTNTKNTLQPTSSLAYLRPASL